MPPGSQTRGQRAPESNGEWTRYSRSRVSSYDFFNVLRQDSRADVSDLIRAYFQGAY